jgi:hypothetical protein
VEFATRVPTELSGDTETLIRSVGSIVRVQNLTNGFRGYGMRIDLRCAAGAVIAEDRVPSLPELAYSVPTMV